MQLGEEVVRDLLLRLRRIEGQARGVQRMLEEGRECADVVHQVTAMRAALGKVAMTVVSENLEECIRTEGPARDVAIQRAKQAFLEVV